MCIQGRFAGRGACCNTDNCETEPETLLFVLQGQIVHKQPEGYTSAQCRPHWRPGAREIIWCSNAGKRLRFNATSILIIHLLFTQMYLRNTGWLARAKTSVTTTRPNQVCTSMKLRRYCRIQKFLPDRR